MHDRAPGLLRPMRHRILVVEDDPTLRLVLQDNLRSEGYDVEVAADGVAGVRNIQAITPDLIPDEADEWLAASEQHHLDRIFLVAPSSTPQRLADTVAASRGSHGPSCCRSAPKAPARAPGRSPMAEAALRLLSPMPTFCSGVSTPIV